MNTAEQHRERLRELSLSVNHWKTQGKWRGPKPTYADVEMMLRLLEKFEVGVRMAREMGDEFLRELP